MSSQQNSVPPSAASATSSIEVRGQTGLYARLAAWQGDVASLAAGSLFPLAFAPYGYGFLTYLLLTVFFLACLNVSAMRAAWRGWLFGIGQFAIGAVWLHMGLQYSSALTVVSASLTVVAVALLAMYPALAAFLSAWLSARRPLCLLLLVLPSAWVLAEYARSSGWTAFPWLLTGYTQIDTPLAGYAPILGVYGTGMIAALVAGLLASLLLKRRNVLVPLTVMVGIFVCGWLLSQISWTEPQGQPLKVSLLQGNAVQDEKWSHHMRTRILNWYQEQTREHWNSDLIVWPENAIADTTANVAAYLSDLKTLSVRDGKDIMLGVVEGDFEKGKYFNSLVSLRGGTYHKRRLIPIAEYSPWSAAPTWLVDALRLPMSDFQHGEEEQPLLSSSEHPLGTSICFEIAFSDEIRRALPAATLLANISNDAAFRESSEPYQHHQIARFRALETERFLVRAVNTGISAIIGPKGNVVASADTGKEAVVTAKVQPLSGSTPYVRLGDVPLIVLALGLLAFAGVLRMQRSTQPS
jgi:apolipoprotein N-acyltransferase